VTAPVRIQMRYPQTDTLTRAPDPRFPSLEAFGRRPLCQRHPSSETTPAPTMLHAAGKNPVAVMIAPTTPRPSYASTRGKTVAFMIPGNRAPACRSTVKPLTWGSLPPSQRASMSRSVLAERILKAAAHSTSFLAEGIVLVLLGMLAIFVPLFATITVTVILGWIFLASGIMGLITTFGARQAPGFWCSLVSALIALGVGVILIAKPITGAVSLTLVLIVFFVVEGAATIMYALEHRRELSGRWEWMLVSGIIDLVLAGIIFAGLPGTAEWALGLLVGINMVFGGMALVVIALHARLPARTP